MIFVLSAKDDRLFCMLNEQDVNDMRGGRTVFVDEHQLKGARFLGVVLSLHRTNQEAIEVLNRAGHGVTPELLVVPQPVKGESRCKGCQAICAEAMLFKGMCVSCWCEKAERLEHADVMGMFKKG